jgi:hypothetical protein
MKRFNREFTRMNAKISVIGKSNPQITQMGADVPDIGMFRTTEYRLHGKFL